MSIPTIKVEATNLIDVVSENCPPQPGSITLEPGSYYAELTKSNLKYRFNGLSVNQLCLFVGQGTEGGEVFLIASLSTKTPFKISKESKVFAFAIDQDTFNNSGSATVEFKQQK